MTATVFRQLGVLGQFQRTPGTRSVSTVDVALNDLELPKVFAQQPSRHLLASLAICRYRV